MTDLEIYTIVVEHDQLQFGSDFIECNNIECEECPLGGKHHGPMLCVNRRIPSIIDNLSTLEFQHKATK